MIRLHTDLARAVAHGLYAEDPQQMKNAAWSLAQDVEELNKTVDRMRHHLLQTSRLAESWAREAERNCEPSILVQTYDALAETLRKAAA